MTRKDLEPKLHKVPLILHPTDTDNHAALRLVWIDSETRRLKGPAIDKGDMVRIRYDEPEIFEFDNPDGTSCAYLITSIEGVIDMTHELDNKGRSLQSAPVWIGFTEGSFTAVDRNGQVWSQSFAESRIDLKANRGDTIVVGG